MVNKSKKVQAGRFISVTQKELKTPEFLQQNSPKGAAELTIPPIYVMLI